MAVTWKKLAYAANLPLTPYAVGDLIYADSTTTLAKLADVAVGSYLKSGGVGAAPAWATLNQAAVAGLTTADGPSFAHLHLADVAAIYTAAESWIGPSSTTGIYFKGGNAGIGIATPGAKLQVAGAIQITGGGWPTTGAGFVLIWDGTNSVLQSSDRSGVTNKPLLFEGSYIALWNGAEKVRMDSNGCFGIGEQAPTSLLQVKGLTSITGGAADTTGLNGLHIYFASNIGYISCTQPGVSNRALVIAGNSVGFTIGGTAGVLNLAVTGVVSMNHYGAGTAIFDASGNISSGVLPLSLGGSGYAGAALTDYSGTSTIVGWSSFGTKTLYYKKIGKTVFVWFYIYGPSNNATTTFTLPYSSGLVTCRNMVETADNSIYSDGMCDLPTNSNIVTFWFKTDYTAFGAAGNKLVAGFLCYETN